jgi:tetratricopeptide (TPR) repeat protein
MKTSRLRKLSILLVLVLLLAACGKTEESLPADTPEPTETPIPPTATPSAADILPDAWQAYEDEDYDTAQELAEQARDLAEDSGEESGEAYALLGLITLETGTTARAYYYFEDALELGYQDERVADALSPVYSELIDELIAEILISYDPDTILADLDQAQEYLEDFQLFVPDNPQIDQYSQFLHPEVFDPANYAEADFPTGEIETLLARIESRDIINLNNNHINGLIEDYPENPVVLFISGVKHLWDDEYEEAIDLFSSSTEIEPGNHIVWEYMAYAYENLGAIMHARDALINCLLLNPENNYAYDDLGWMNNWRSYWEDTSFSFFGFTMEHSWDDEFLPIGSASPTEGIVEAESIFNQGEDDEWAMLIQISWQPADSASQTTQELQEQISGSLNVNTPRWKSEFKTFDYGAIPIIFREYGYLLPGGSESADAIIAGGFCGDTTYIFDFRYLQDGYELEDLRWWIALYLESFNCESQ